MTDLVALNAAVQADKGASRTVKAWINAATPLIQPPPPSGNGSVTGRHFIDVSYMNIDRTSRDVDPNSVAEISLLVQYCKQGMVWNIDAWSTPEYWLPDGTATVNVSLDTNTSPTNSVVIPYTSACKPSPDADAHLTVGYTSNGAFWEFEGFSPATMHAHSYATGNVITGNGVPIAGRVAVLCTIAGNVRKYEPARGLIDHGIRIALPCTSKSFVPPAKASDGDTPGGISSGKILRLKANANLTGLNANQLMQCAALQKYGAPVSDSNGNTPAMSAFAEPGTTGLDSLPLSVLQAMEVLA